jgi:uncharacterized membrane protein YedE/YeeE
MKMNEQKQRLFGSFVILLVGVFTSGFIRMSSVLWSNIIFVLSIILFVITLILALIYKAKPPKTAGISSLQSADPDGNKTNTKIKEVVDDIFKVKK